eukprot:TRINITY_DN3287_c0_g1_i3.p1 TRINITY_DN3287_c0_g1~~TRINITY_DN3287_c0_g1_i3.p1  ORF type:complete len:374 (-),score=90.65 TRINITY_DN3287_c0_g1_i3:921-2042(-)
MANNKVMTNNRNIQCAGKQSLLPPKSPFPSISPAYADYGSSSMGPSGIPKARGHRQRQRAPSESFLLEEQPSWLDDLLNEPETPVRRGSHRRSSSDSFAYLEASSNSSNIGIASEDVKYSTTSVPLWGSLDFDRIGDVQQTSFFMEDSSGHHNKSWVSSLNPAAHTSYSFARNNIVLQSPGSSCASGEPDGIPSTATEKRDPEESGSHDGKGSSERGDPAKSVASETDPKRTKQQFAQRSRVRKLQYIAELERAVQALQVDGLDISAELEFLGKQNLILSMENKALKQRLDSLAQEHLIKYMEQEVLEREIARLKVMLYQQQQQLQHPQQQQQSQPPHSTRHRRSSSRDLDTHFANLSLKHKEASSGREPVSG